MADKGGKHDLGAGTSWSLFAENVLFEDSEDLEASDSSDAETTRLHKEDMALFGLCPARDPLNLLICRECQKVLYPVTLKRHYERRHTKLLPTVKSPPRHTLPTPKEIKSPLKHQPPYNKSKILKSPDNNSFIRIEEVDPTDISVKIEEVPLTIPNFNHTAKAKLPKINIKCLTGSSGKAKTSPVNSKPPASILAPTKKGTGIKDKEYDPDRHCGVWMAEQTRNCTRSLTCKTHSLSLRRAVPGRSKAFDVLLAEHKAKANSIKEAGISSGGSTPTPSPTKSASCTPAFPVVKPDTFGNGTNTQTSQAHRSPKVAAALSASSFNISGSGHHGDTAHTVDYLSDENIGSSNLPTIPYHPRPLKVNTFGSGLRKGGGCIVFNRRMNHFRCATKAMLEKFNNPSLRGQKNDKGRENGETSKVPTANRQEGMCTIQVMDQGSARQTVSGFKSSLNVSSFNDPSQLGPVPRVKTKKGLAGMKRQISADVQSTDASSFQSPNKRRHSVDSNPNILAVSSPSTPTETNMQNGLKPLRELGHVVANIDSVSPYEIKTVGSSFPTGSPQAKNSLTLNTGASSISLNSSLNLCHTMGINPVGSGGQSDNLQGLTQTFNVQGATGTIVGTNNQNTVSHVSGIPGVTGVLGLYGASQNSAVAGSQSLNSPSSSCSVSYSVAPNVSVTQGMMVSLPNIPPTQATVLYQSGLSVTAKDGISIAGSLRSQLQSSSGILLRSQPVSPLPNGIGPSPPPACKSYTAQYATNIITTCASYMVGNTKLKSSPTTSAAAVAFANRQQTSSNVPRVSQLLLQQPNLSRVQLAKKEKMVQRGSSLTKQSSNVSPKYSQPPSLSSSPTISSSQGPNFLTSNNSTGLNTNQPITQLNQNKVQQVQHAGVQRVRPTYSSLNTPTNIEVQSSLGQTSTGYSPDTRHQEILSAGNSSQSGLGARGFQHQGGFLETLAPTPSDGDTASLL